MKIVYVVPGIMEQEELTRRGALLQEWACSDTTVDIVCVPEGPASVESMYEEYLSIPATAKVIAEMEKQGYDAAILGCAGDPGLDAMREITTDMLVVGPGAVSYLTAAMLGHKFAVVTVDDTMLNSCYELGYKAGCLPKVGGAVAVNIPVLELSTNRAQSVEKLITACKKTIAEHGADTLVLGCMSMGFLNVAEELSAAVGVPAVNPAMTAIKFAEAVVGSKLKHSKKAYATPPKLRDGKVKSLDELYLRP